MTLLTRVTRCNENSNYFENIIFSFFYEAEDITLRTTLKSRGSLRKNYDLSLKGLLLNKVDKWKYNYLGPLEIWSSWANGSHTLFYYVPRCVYPVLRYADVSRWSEIEIAYCLLTVRLLGSLKPSKLYCQRIGSWVSELRLWFIATKKLINKVTEGRGEWSKSFAYTSYPLSQNKKYWE